MYLLWKLIQIHQSESELLICRRAKLCPIKLRTQTVHQLHGEESTACSSEQFLITSIKLMSPSCIEGRTDIHIPTLNGTRTHKLHISFWPKNEKESRTLIPIASIWCRYRLFTLQIQHVVHVSHPIGMRISPRHFLVWLGSENTSLGRCYRHAKKKATPHKYLPMRTLLCSSGASPACSSACLHSLSLLSFSANYMLSIVTGCTENLHGTPSWHRSEHHVLHTQTR